MPTGAIDFSNQTSAGFAGYYTGTFGGASFGDSTFSIWVRNHTSLIGPGFDRIWDCDYLMAFALFRHSTDSLAHEIFNYFPADSGTFNLADNVWTNVTWTRKASTGACGLYLNGVSSATWTGPTGTVPHGSFGIGNDNSTGPSTEPYRGDLAHAAMWNSELNLTQVAAIVSAPPTGALHYWKLDTAASSFTDQGSGTAITLSFHSVGGCALADTDGPYTGPPPVTGSPWYQYAQAG